MFYRQERMMMNPPDWERRERERKVMEIVRSFLFAYLAFRRLHGEYQKGSLRFSDLARFVDDRGQSILFTLKENCHSLFRRNDEGVSDKEQVFDLIVGTLFHLAMKLREDLYQVEFYGPKFTRLSEKKEEHQDPQSLVQQFQGLLSRARSGMKEEMEEMDLLFKEFLPPFQDLLREYRENGLLLRFLMEEKGLLREVWGERALETLLEKLYGPNSAQPDRLAGESYFQSAFYPQATQAFSRALNKNPGDEEIQFLHHLSRGMEHFYSLASLSALESFEKCLSFSISEELLERYRPTILTACQRFGQESSGRRKSDQGPELVAHAQSLRRRWSRFFSGGRGQKTT
jgi:tetratricopeptide (TPR) repeat protein